jgi:hypothetical protein
MTISLNNLSNQLADVGRRDDALAASEEAAGQHRTLATSLNNLSIRLADLGRRDDALAARQEAAAIQRRLDEA